MSEKQHHYLVKLHWTGNDGAGTSDYRSYRRDHDIVAPGKPPIAGSSDPSFRGDAARWNPEELLVASLSSCHKLWYLGLCAQSGVTVIAYDDEAEGTMIEEASGAGQFVGVTLRPKVLIDDSSDLQRAQLLHDQAHEMCFIARSVNFPVTVEPTIGKTASSP